MAPFDELEDLLRAPARYFTSLQVSLNLLSFYIFSFSNSFPISSCLGQPHGYPPLGVGGLDVVIFIRLLPIGFGKPRAREWGGRPLGGTLEGLLH